MSGLGHDEWPRLSSLDVLGGDNALRAAGRLAAGQAAARRGDAADRLIGEDATGSVRVTVDDRGRVVDVGVDRRWRERLGAERFADGLFGAYTDAVRAAMDVAAGAALSRPPDPPRPRSASSPLGWDPGQDRQPEDHRRWQMATWAALGEIEAELVRMRRASAAAVPEETVRGPNGLLTARRSGGGVTSVTGDTRLIAYADADQLRTDALAVLRATVSERGGRLV
jgi:hypothetical protein